ncbi:uncharacterized protein LOC115353946 [Myripristis murdjan]|uniref:uncharacterized protein LOC115353946 n=1 Tax=Myripristis murdjan TaxID=586833 RepID=UPI0011761386|nr:uncharacterized protein LOC115353946 [Myripristis murdjan]
MERQGVGLTGTGPEVGPERRSGFGCKGSSLRPSKILFSKPRQERTREAPGTREAAGAAGPGRAGPGRAGPGRAGPSQSRIAAGRPAPGERRQRRRTRPARAARVAGRCGRKERGTRPELGGVACNNRRVDAGFPRTRSGRWRKRPGCSSVRQRQFTPAWVASLGLRPRKYGMSPPPGPRLLRGTGPPEACRTEGGCDGAMAPLFCVDSELEDLLFKRMGLD